MKFEDWEWIWEEESLEILVWKRRFRVGAPPPPRNRVICCKVRVFLWHWLWGLRVKIGGGMGRGFVEEWHGSAREYEFSRKIRSFFWIIPKKWASRTRFFGLIEEVLENFTKNWLAGMILLVLWLWITYFRMGVSSPLALPRNLCHCSCEKLRNNSFFSD